MFPPVELGRSWEALKPDARMYALLLEQSLPKVMANGISEVDQLLLQKKGTPGWFVRGCQVESSKHICLTEFNCNKTIVFTLYQVGLTLHGSYKSRGVVSLFGWDLLQLEWFHWRAVETRSCLRPFVVRVFIGALNFWRFTVKWVGQRNSSYQTSSNLFC